MGRLDYYAWITIIHNNLVEVKKIKELYPEKNDAIITVMDELPYETLIGGMDALLSGGFPEIAVATGGAQ